MHKYRTHTCGELTSKDIGKIVRIAGWVHSKRDHGGVVFFDLRDHYGISQVVISENENLLDIIGKIPTESTVSVEGEVLRRPSNMFNSELLTGEIEIACSKIVLLGRASNQLPFEIDNSMDAREDLRLRYRFLDLRNDKLHNNIILRSKLIREIREKMVSLGFLEIQTPILTSSSPEGARDYLVPSRLHPGKFYALPQAPQQFKQLLMVAGFDKYFQIAPCFRDEDARADRSPGEFYQLDLEMAFATQEDVFIVVEKVISELFKKFSTWDISAPFPRIPYKEALLHYGTDKPDLRNPLLIYDATYLFNDTEFNVFKNKTIRVIPVPNCNTQPRSFFDNLEKSVVEEVGAKGLGWIKVNKDMTFSGSIAKFINDVERHALIELTGAIGGMVIFFVADKLKIAEKIAGFVRNEVAKRLDIIKKDVYRFCWIVDFPMFELNSETGQIEFSHNPFSMPQGGMNALNEKSPLDILAYQYDIVCNGIELSSGAVRNHETDIMVKAFEIAGYSVEEVENRFPALFNAFQYGAPPHAGIAPGIDRIVMLLANEPNIREVIAFPMNSKAQDLLMGAPCGVNKKQLEDVHIKTISNNTIND